VAASGPLLIGQSLELWRAPLTTALDRRDAPPLLQRARRQAKARAAALDLNLGFAPDEQRLAALPWLIATLRADPLLASLPLLIDVGEPARLRRAAELLDGASDCLLNAVPLGDPLAPALFALAARSGWGVVLSPRTLDTRTPATAELLAVTLAAGAEGARDAGIEGLLLLDALAYPPATDADRARRSLTVLRALRGLSAADVRPLVAVGNVGFAATATVRPALRSLYAAAAVAAGAAALLLPAEERRSLAAIAVTQGDEAGLPPGERAWLGAVAEAAAFGEPLPAPPVDGWPGASASLQAWALLTAAAAAG